MAEWRIHPLAAAAEIDDVIAVEDACFTNPWTREMYEAELRKEGVSFILLARDDAGRLIGFCSYWRVLDELHVNNLAVLPSHRRRGLGRALLQRALDDGRRSGATRAYLEVRASNADARHLYARLGFSEAGVRRGYYSKPDEDGIVFVRDRLDRP
ncbi:MAG: ribosomal protein S18-alanine N-acetyltransferase [Vicinamibacterales bacterium]